MRRQIKKTLSFLSILFINSVFAQTIKIGVINDLNGTECQTLYPSNSIKAFDTLIGKFAPEHIIFPGDLVHGECLSYSGNEPYASVTDRMWQEFDKQFFNKGRKIATLAVSPGNHDAPYISSSSRSTFKTEHAAFIKHWTNKEKVLGLERLQITGAQDRYPFYWAYIYKNILFIVLHSTKTSGSVSDSVLQKKWLKALLASPEAKSTKVKIAFGHVPIYPVLDPSVGSKYSAFLASEQSGKSDALTDILIDGGVSLLAVGHSHAPYPAELVRKRDNKKLLILSMPCAHSPRTLYSKSSRSDRGFAILQVNENTISGISIKNYSTGSEISYDYYPKAIDVKSSAVNYQKISRELYR